MFVVYRNICDCAWYSFRGGPWLREAEVLRPLTVREEEMRLSKNAMTLVFISRVAHDLMLCDDVNVLLLPLLFFSRIESLLVVPISKVSAQQRAGRAGRTGGCSACVCMSVCKTKYLHIQVDTMLSWYLQSLFAAVLGRAGAVLSSLLLGLLRSVRRGDHP